jgi:hypothetical protein
MLLSTCTSWLLLLLLLPQLFLFLGDNSTAGSNTAASHCGIC